MERAEDFGGELMVEVVVLEGMVWFLGLGFLEDDLLACEGLHLTRMGKNVLGQS